MRKLSVTEYLIAQNQAQTTVTTYARFGDALNAAEDAASVPGALSPLRITSTTLLQDAGFTYATVEATYARLNANAPREGYKAEEINLLGAFDVLSYVVAWSQRDDEGDEIGPTLYTAHAGNPVTH